jgi:hypothetical protein
MTPTPTFTNTVGPGPWPTPTLVPGDLQLVSAGPPAWTYRWWGTTDGFRLYSSCGIGMDTPSSDWTWRTLPSGYLECYNYSSPVFVPVWYEPFVVIEKVVPGAMNTMITYDVIHGMWSVPIEGPECANTPTITVTPTNTVSVDVPVSRNNNSILLFIMSGTIAMCLVMQWLRN